MQRPRRSLTLLFLYPTFTTSAVWVTGRHRAQGLFRHLPYATESRLATEQDTDADEVWDFSPFLPFIFPSYSFHSITLATLLNNVLEAFILVIKILLPDTKYKFTEVLKFYLCWSSMSGLANVYSFILRLQTAQAIISQSKGCTVVTSTHCF